MLAAKVSWCFGLVSQITLLFDHLEREVFSILENLSTYTSSYQLHILQFAGLEVAIMCERDLCCFVFCSLIISSKWLMAGFI